MRCQIFMYVSTYKFMYACFPNSQIVMQLCIQMFWAANTETMRQKQDGSTNSLQCRQSRKADHGLY